MTKKEKFLEEVMAFFTLHNTTMEENLSEEAMSFVTESLKEKEKSDAVTEKGKPIMQYVQDNYNLTDNFKSKDIAEGLFMSPRAVSGIMRKLLTDGYLIKVSASGISPIIYNVTEKGLNVDLTK